MTDEGTEFRVPQCISNCVFLHLFLGLTKPYMEGSSHLWCSRWTESFLLVAQLLFQCAIVPEILPFKCRIPARVSVGISVEPAVLMCCRQDCFFTSYVKFVPCYPFGPGVLYPIPLRVQEDGYDRNFGVCIYFKYFFFTNFRCRCYAASCVTELMRSVEILGKSAQVLFDPICLF